jgi:hypothetical protein
VLLTLADKTAPAKTFGETEAARKECHAAWLKWWNQHKDKVDLAKAEVGLQLANRPTLARKAARDFMHAIATGGDKALLEKSSAVPFYLSFNKALETREQFDAFFAEVAGRATDPAPRFKFDITRTLTLAQQEPYCSSENDLAHVKGLPSATTLAVHVEIHDGGVGGRREVYALLVRVGAGRGRVIGLCELRGAGK